MARLLMAIVIVFLCCHSTKIVVNFYEAYQVRYNRLEERAERRHHDILYIQIMSYGKLSEDNPVWIMYLVKINHLLLAINSAINIVIYSFKVMKYNIPVWS